MSFPLTVMNILIMIGAALFDWPLVRAELYFNVERNVRHLFIYYGYLVLNLGLVPLPWCELHQWPLVVLQKTKPLPPQRRFFSSTTKEKGTAHLRLTAPTTSKMLRYFIVYCLFSYLVLVPQRRLCLAHWAHWSELITWPHVWGPQCVWFNWFMGHKTWK